MADPHFAIKKHFRKLKDPRRAHGRLHLLMDLVVISVCAIICGANDWQQVVTFAKKRYMWLEGFLQLPSAWQRTIPLNASLTKLIQSHSNSVSATA